jgi:hypothetical protein
MLRPRPQVLAVIGLFFAATLNHANSQTWFTNGLIAHWLLNGNLNDAAGTNNCVAYSATPAPNRFGTPNSAYFFNGSNSYLRSIAPMRDLSNATFSVWFNAANVTALQNTLFSDSTTASGNDFACLLAKVGTSSAVYVACSKAGGGGGLWVTNGTSGFSQLLTNNWLQLTWVMQATQQQVFVNGTLSASVATNASNIGFHHQGFVIGADCATSPYQKLFLGLISDLRVYNRALSAKEVASLYYFESRKQAHLIKSYTIDFDGLIIGGSYQLQASSDLLVWTNWGASFTAASDSYTNVIPHQRVDDWPKLFFRLQTQ